MIGPRVVTLIETIPRDTPVGQYIHDPVIIGVATETIPSRVAGIAIIRTSRT